ncbi:MAG: hypothetical protein JXA03_06225 [Bacteroidales bacterium]|nr:hypothetical protein [Bacteroidales bacterium]
MNSIMILVKDKTVFVRFGEILDKGRLDITNALGHQVFNKDFTKSHYEIISLREPGGKYWLTVDSDGIRIKKSFHLK